MLAKQQGSDVMYIAGHTEGQKTEQLIFALCTVTTRLQLTAEGFQFVDLANIIGTQDQEKYEKRRF